MRLPLPKHSSGARMLQRPEPFAPLCNNAIIQILNEHGIIAHIDPNYRVMVMDFYIDGDGIEESEWVDLTNYNPKQLAEWLNY